MNRRSRIWVTLAVSLVVALLAYWYWQLEWEIQEIDLGPSAAARQNPLLVLQQLLNQNQIDNRVQRGFSNLQTLADEQLHHRDALILLHSHGSLRDAQIDRIWQWVQQGGLLILAAHNPYFGVEDYVTDPLLQRMGLALLHDWPFVAIDGETLDLPEDLEDWEPEMLAPGTNLLDENEQEHIDLGEECPLYFSVPLVDSLGEGEHQAAPRLAVNPTLILWASEESTTRALASREDNIYLAHMRLGAGDILTFASADALRNTTIGCGDNAYIVWQWLRDRRQVWLLINTDSPSFWRYLWYLSALGCVALLAALGCWVWYKAVRFGPVLHTQRQTRRAFIEHIRASALFIDRHQGRGALVAQLREQIWQLLHRRYPGLSSATHDDQLTRLAQLSNMNPTDLRMALFDPIPEGAADFVERVQRLQHLRNCL